MNWLTWSWIPGLHGLAWLQAGWLAKEPSYYAFGFVYSIPTLMLIFSRRLSIRLLLISWGLCYLHLFIQHRRIKRRIEHTNGPPDGQDNLMQALLQAALKHGGSLTVTQAVMETGASFNDIEHTLQEMLASGYVYTRDQVDTGVLEYVFTEMG